MNQLLQPKIEAKMKAIAGHLIEHNMSQISRAMCAAVEAQQGEKFEYPVSINLTLRPRGTECDVQGKIGYKVNFKDQIEWETVSLQPELEIEN